MANRVPPGTSCRPFCKIIFCSLIIVALKFKDIVNRELLVGFYKERVIVLAWTLFQRRSYKFLGSPYSSCGVESFPIRSIYFSWAEFFYIDFRRLNPFHLYAKRYDIGGVHDIFLIGNVYVTKTSTVSSNKEHIIWHTNCAPNIASVKFCNPYLIAISYINRFTRASPSIFFNKVAHNSDSFSRCFSSFKGNILSKPAVDYSVAFSLHNSFNFWVICSKC
ncbi:hypothetical protein SDC9_168852 [bioreactor metagenome]|uniref:Uncharacterized protein n=1 Tax=bioreactor metagenome TaxID=1076179 RepID=A0A645G662_9ZZZZ